MAEEKSSSPMKNRAPILAPNSRDMYRTYRTVKMILYGAIKLVIPIAGGD